MSSVRLYLPKDLRPADNRFSVGKSLQEVIRRFPDGVPPLDPIEDMNIKDDQFKKVIRVRSLCGLSKQCSKCLNISHSRLYS